MDEGGERIDRERETTHVFHDLQLLQVSSFRVHQFSDVFLPFNLVSLHALEQYTFSLQRPGYAFRLNLIIFKLLYKANSYMYNHVHMYLTCIQFVHAYTCTVQASPIITCTLSSPKDLSNYM